MKLSLPDRMFTPSAALAAILLAFGFAATASAATDKSGVIEDETWTLAMSPIRVIGDISVYSLTIEPGVEVLFTGNFEFDCPGVLDSAGNETNKIWFHGDTGITWKGLKFLNSAPGSVFDHCIVENSNQSGITIINTSLNLSNCLIRNNSITGNGGGVAVIVDTTGITLPSFYRCEITNNSAAGSGGGVYFLPSGGASGTIVFEECKVNSNSATFSSSGGGGGIYIGSTATVSIRHIDCEIANNAVASSGVASGSQSFRGGGLYHNGQGKHELLRCRLAGNSINVHNANWDAQAYALGGGVSS